MTALPALSRAYWTRGNIPFGANNANTAALNGFNMWALVMGLLDLFTTEGTASGTRAAGSIYICRGSSDGAGAGGAISAVGVPGTNRWWNAGVFPGLVGAGAGTNHHWILIENVVRGVEVLFNFTQNSNSGYVCWSVGKSGAFSGGSATTQPAASAGVTSFQLGQAGYSATDGGQVSSWVDTNFGGTFYGHLTVAANGDFWWAASRVGSGIFSFFGALWSTTGAQVGDSYNDFLLGGANIQSGRGSATGGYINSAAWCASRAPNGAQSASGGIVVPYAGGSNISYGLGSDAISGSYNAQKLDVWGLTPQYVKRGTLPDLYICGTEAVGAPVPAAGAGQERLVIGDMIVPCMVVQPLV